MENRSVNAGRPQAVESRRRPPQRKRARPFMHTYLMILAVLLAVSACALVYVHSALKSYEASQPESILASQMEQLRKLEAKGKFEEMMSLEKMRGELGASEAEIAQFKKDFLASNITFQENHSGAVDPAKKVFDVLSNGCKVATATLNHIGQEKRLLILTLDQWSVSEMEITGYEIHLTVPADLIVKSNGTVLQGAVTDGKATYDLRSLTPPNVEICDILGNSVPFDQKNLPTFTEYKVTVPSNYTICALAPVPLTAATLAPMEELKYVKEYCPEVPDTATYILSILSGEPDFKILDGNGKEVAFTMENRVVTIEEKFAGQDSLPISVDIDPLKVAKLWSLFMTKDLTGANYGYGQLSPYLIKGSYLQDVAWKWATGQDITFTSTHTLKDPPFQVENVSNYVVYAENCFSCHIRLEKKMLLTRTGEEVNDVINSTFYFVKYDDTDNGVNDPHWVLADYHEIL